MNTLSLRLFTIYGLTTIFAKVYGKPISIRIIPQLAKQLESYYNPKNINSFSKGRMDAYAIYNRLKINRLLEYVVYRTPFLHGQYFNLPKHKGTRIHTKSGFSSGLDSLVSKPVTSGSLLNPREVDFDFCQSALYTAKEAETPRKIFETEKLSEISQEYEQIFRHLLDKKDIRVSSHKWTHTNPADKIYDAGQLIEQTANRPLQIQNQLSATQLRKKRVAELKKKALKPTKRAAVELDVKAPSQTVSVDDKTTGVARPKGNETDAHPAKHNGPKVPERFPTVIFKVERDVSEELEKEVEQQIKKPRQEAQARIDHHNNELLIIEEKQREKEREETLRLEKKKVEQEWKKKVEARRLIAAERKNRLRRQERYENKLKRLVDEGYSDPEEELKDRKQRRSNWRLGTKHALRKRTNQDSEKSPAATRKKKRIKISNFDHSNAINEGQVVILHENSDEEWPPCEHGHLAEIVEHDQLSITVVLLTDKSTSPTTSTTHEQSSSVFRTDTEIQICTEDIKSIISGLDIQ